MRITSISIDVDPVSCYYKIHSLGPPPKELRTRILTAALPRYAALFAERGIQATFFLVGEDLDVRALGSDAIGMRAAVRDLVAAGHEIASHSYSHPYDMAALDAATVRQELRRTHDLIQELCGTEPCGFRAPGYDISGTMLQELVALHYTYDSSIFPAPGYYAAKAIVMAALRIFGKQSGAVMTNPKALWAPLQPYRPDIESPWKPGKAAIVELPIAVTPTTRTPVIGTNLLLAPNWLRKHWLRSVTSQPFFNLEMHGIDLCDADDGLPPALVARQPELRIGVAEKTQRLGEILDRITASGSRFLTLAQYCEEKAIRD